MTTTWTETEWIPVDRQLPTQGDGILVSMGAKVGVFVLTVDMILNGKNPEPRGFHLDAKSFDDDDSGKNRVMFWAPCWSKEDLEDYESTAGDAH